MLACALPAAAAPSPALQQALDRVVAEGAPGAIALVRDGSTTTRLASGVARISPRTPIAPGDRFRVANLDEDSLGKAEQSLQRALAVALC